MIVNLLIKSIREMCENAVKDFRMPTQNSTLRAPNIINGYLAPKRSNADDDFPFVIVRPESGTCDSGASEIHVSIIIGCYSEDYDGYEYCINVMERIKNKIITLPYSTLDNKYQMAFPIKWNLTNDQPYPLWQIDIETIWILKSPENTDEF